MKKGVARGLTSLAKISLAAGIIALLLWKKVDLRELAVLLRGLDLRAFAACWFGYGLLFILSARRWKALVEVQGIRARYGALLGFCLIGAFFNNIMPGSMGGDILKAWYCARVDHSRKAGAVSSVLADRIVGFLSLFAIGFLGLVVKAPDLADPPRHLGAEELADHVGRALVAGGQHHQGAVPLGAVLHPHAGGGEARDVVVLDQADLAAHH
ncbi:MAG: lysylphosphatidylglycerol synthase transmembrane domain-containing protein, partial [Chlamydiota bacterium]